VVLLQVERLTAGYTQLPVVQDVTIRAQAGSLVSIIGPNGSGKSTLLKAIMGFLKPMSGSVTVEDRDVTGWAPHRIVRGGAGYVPQLSNIFVSLTVEENLEMGGFTYAADVRTRMEEVLQTLPDLLAARKKKAGELSGGQRNLLGVARALMIEPKVVLVDEPTAGLAPANSRRIWDELLRISAAGKAVVVVEQNVDLALRNSTWTYVLVAGKNRLEGPSESVMQEDLHGIFLGHEPTDGPGVAREQPPSTKPVVTPQLPSNTVTDSEEVKKWSAG
jgi:ABC-type branched-subunit amino acid transport system ATPase component